MVGLLSLVQYQELVLDILRALEVALKELGSGLDAIDKSGDWSYYEAAQKEVDRLLSQLPNQVRSKLPTRNPGMTDWSSFLREVQALRRSMS